MLPQTQLGNRLLYVVQVFLLSSLSYLNEAFKSTISELVDT